MIPCIKKLCYLLLLGQILISNVWAASSFRTSSRNQPAIESSLNTSPNDINQLLSTLERENQSFISQSLFTPMFRNLESITENVDKKTGLNIGFDYIPLYQHAEQHLGKQNASGGEFEIFGRWQFKREQFPSSMIGFKLEDKHRYTAIYPGVLAEQFNSIIRTVSGYEELKLSVTELWYQGMLITDTLGVRAGKIDLTSVMNSYAFDSRKFYFLSDVFSSSPAINKPQKGLGAIAAIKLVQHIYLAFGINDLNGEENTSGFSTLHKGEFIRALEFGYRDKIVNPQSDNYHLFIWQSDARKDRAIPSDKGLSVVLQKNVNNRFIPFFKMNINSGHVKPIKQLYTSGFGYHYPFNRKFGLLGAALGFARLSEKEKGEQVIFETFYRLQLTPYSQLSPDIQIIKHQHVTTGSKWAPTFNIRYRVAV